MEKFEDEDRPILEIVEGESEHAKVHPISSVTQILETVVKIGRRGMQVQRFKSLGEMNAKELFTTTMDPSARKLLRVKMDEENQVEADRIFTILMGDVVEPRPPLHRRQRPQRTKSRHLTVSVHPPFYTTSAAPTCA